MKRDDVLVFSSCLLARGVNVNGLKKPLYDAPSSFPRGLGLGRVNLEYVSHTIPTGFWIAAMTVFPPRWLD